MKDKSATATNVKGEEDRPARAGSSVSMRGLAEQRARKSRAAWFFAFDMLLVAAGAVSIWQARSVLSERSHQREQIAENERVISELGTHLARVTRTKAADARLGKEDKAEDEDAAPAAGPVSWSGFNPSGAPAGQPATWARTPNWDQIGYASEGTLQSTYRYGVITRGAQAFLLAYGGAGADDLYREYKAGRLVREWRVASAAITSAPAKRSAE